MWLRKAETDDSPIHVIPIGDLYEHVLSEDCWCSPVLDEDDTTGEDIVIHSSADQREKFETGERKPS